MEEDLVASEEEVDLLQRELGRLGVEVVNEGHEAGVEDAEVDVCPVADGLDRHGSNLDDKEGKLQDR